ncbi:hypothetical protein L798_07430 [Zootermopsis nevadensis]|uniref:Uncharacterized protein n=1 Tax=Zootermopsis nevadensis TaxID=136037 RepID=A0A067RGZ0_ZOONE|nr:hypothetical protein L798_07430 [Zootermopsis nevadensis]
MSIIVLSELPMSGSTLQDLAAFKDKILSVAKHSGELRLKYRSFPDRDSASKRQSRQRRSSGDTQPTTLITVNNVQSFLKLSESLIKSENSSVVLEEKEKLLQQLHIYMYHLCLAKDQKIPVGKCHAVLGILMSVNLYCHDLCVVHLAMCQSSILLYC